MYATQPWSGNYELRPTLYTTAHTTHFTAPGWGMMGVGDGSGMLEKGGSYVRRRSCSAIARSHTLSSRAGT